MSAGSTRARLVYHGAVLLCAQGSKCPLALVLTSSAALACTDGQSHVQPPDNLAETWVFARQLATDGPWQLTVHERDDAWVAEVDAAELVYLLGYEDSAETLGLGEGRQPSCAVRRPHAVLLLAEADGGWGWRQVAQAPEALLDAIVGGAGRCDVCAPVVMRGIIAPHNHRYSGVAWFEDGSVLGAYIQGLARITDDSIERLPDCPDLPPGPTAVAALGGDRFLVSGQQGHLSTVRFSDAGRTCVVESSTAAPSFDVPALHQPFTVVAANPESPGDFDFYALRGSGELYHWSAAGLRRVGAHTLHPQSTYAQAADLVRLDARRLLTSAGSREVKFWEDGVELRSDLLELPVVGVSNTPRDRVTTLEVDQRFGRYLAGTAAGELWARPFEGSGWSPVFRSPVLEAVGSVLELEERFMVVLSGGDIVLWHHEGEVCPESQRIPLSSNAGAGRAVLQDAARILLADAIGNSQGSAGVVWVER